MLANRKRRLRSSVSSMIPVFIMVRVKQCRPLVGISHLLRIGTTPRHLTLVFSVTSPSASQPMAVSWGYESSATPNLSTRRWPTEIRFGGVDSPVKRSRPTTRPAMLEVERLFETLHTSYPRPRARRERVDRDRKSRGTAPRLHNS
ncbi:hypothetical protein AVEN_29584-1 [Araneus ventricosus]|uniref:Uncharacterized protein n=1 Tax=Araneus ventricosus TaxID=182803 RepID=A0A4Y2T4A7_ARAVE|nr:hypothetical protein AVEN_29584-1 [Araneus ventricosus]